MRLGVNIDHVATIRQARGGSAPDPLMAALLCEKAGCHSIVAHLREDRRHIQDRDVYLLRKNVRTKFNLEMSASDEIVRIALKILPDESTLVPEKRKELTTEGGLDVAKERRKLARAISRLKRKGIVVSLFIDPEKSQIDASKEIGADYVELHTGEYANAAGKDKKRAELDKIKKAAEYCKRVGLGVNAGHGLDYENVGLIAGIAQIQELNIGHSIISRAVLTGLEKAVRDMIRAMR